MSPRSSSGPAVGQAMGSSPSRGRLLGFRAALVFAGLLPLVWGVSSLMGAVSGGPHLVHDLVGAGVISSVLWLAPLVAMWRPERVPVALPYYLTFVTAAVVAAGLSASNWAVAAVLVVQGGLVALLHPYRWAALRGRMVISPLLLPVALVASAALVRYAVDRAALQATGDVHALAAHYFDQAWFALAVALFAVLAALREDGRRFAGRASGLALAAFGAISMLLPERTSSAGIVWGGAAVVAGLAMVVLIEVEGRRETGRQATPVPPPG
jgi:hypothetical protein